MTTVAPWKKKRLSLISGLATSTSLISCTRNNTSIQKWNQDWDDDIFACFLTHLCKCIKNSNQQPKKWWVWDRLKVSKKWKVSMSYISKLRHFSILPFMYLYILEFLFDYHWNSDWKLLLELCSYSFLFWLPFINGFNRFLLSSIFLLVIWKDETKILSNSLLLLCS